MKRRSFLSAPFAIATMTEAFGEPSSDGWIEPPSQVSVKRELHFEPSHSGQVIIKTDAPAEPRPLVRPEIIDSIWFKGTYEIMPQSLHWKMIDQGWFGEDDVWFPFGENDWEYEHWFAYFQPACEAHDLLCTLFDVSNFWFTEPKELGLGLDLQIHPSTPRYATAKLIDRSWINDFKAAVERKTDFLIVDPIIRPASGAFVPRSAESARG